MVAWMLWFALVMQPPPNGTKFPDGTRQMVVVGTVKEPRVAEVPQKIVVDGKWGPVECGWVWKETFRNYGTDTLVVCLDPEGKPWVFPAPLIWQKLNR